MNLSELRAFLGLINYYGRFISNLATFFAPTEQLVTEGSHLEVDQTMSRHLPKHQGDAWFTASLVPL